MKALTGGFQKLKATVSDAEATLQEELGFESMKRKAEEAANEIKQPRGKVQTLPPIEEEGEGPPGITPPRPPTSEIPPPP